MRGSGVCFLIMKAALKNGKIAWFIMIFLLLAITLSILEFYRFKNRPFVTVSWQMLLQKANPAPQNTLQPQIYYCGSKDGFDYFVVQPVGGAESRCRVSMNDDLASLARFSLSDDRTKWLYRDYSYFAYGGGIGFTTNQTRNVNP